MLSRIVRLSHFSSFSCRRWMFRPFVRVESRVFLLRFSCHAFFFRIMMVGRGTRAVARPSHGPPGSCEWRRLKTASLVTVTQVNVCSFQQKPALNIPLVLISDAMVDFYFWAGYVWGISWYNPAQNNISEIMFPHPVEPNKGFPDSSGSCRVIGLLGCRCAHLRSASTDMSLGQYRLPPTCL